MKRLLTDRVVLLVVLLVVLVAWMGVLGANGYLVAPYDVPYLASSLESVVPLCVLGLAELLVVVTGRGGIDLSVGSVVSLVGMVFGLLVGVWHWPLWLSLLIALACGLFLGAVNGFLVAWLGVPALIATLATYYAYSSLALVINDTAPISTPPVQALRSMTTAVGSIPLQVFTFLLPCAATVWLLANRTNYGRRLYALGTNEAAARFAGLPVVSIRFRAYLLSGLLSGVVAIVTVAQFASARPDAGTVGNGMALPAITIAILGGTAITGGIGRVGGVILASLFVVWLNAGILLAFEDSRGSQYQLLALGAVLVLSAVLNRLTTQARLRTAGRAP
ncbi:ABC transporter permease [Actinocrispum wychmicini]|uniref:Ribose transport system permease protein/erythritol transport system permease protein n=1 Tax=Actinocrispum wychmicini TaxID=1213861 RepID=A0A4R2JB83_9PSEU|nr:ABC transporter permease [Actinocrispum wychmicini]TCO56733.1 ribose transport system permease protein/erythritol transport system permease protein [Actinocrispum wychmicini]